MAEKPYLPSIKELKAQAKRLRAQLAEDGDFVSHCEALELVAAQFGFRDWNTIVAAAGNRRPPPFEIGARMSGSYLGQAFRGEIIGVTILSPGRTRVTIQFDEPVDVVSFDSFSAFRSRVTAIVNDVGETAEKTSDGRPQLAMERL